MKKTLYCFLFLCFFAIACKKTKLKDEKEILAGNWEWVFTEEYLQPNIFTPASLESVVYADSFPKTFELRFQTKGIMYRVQDGESTRDRIVIKSFTAISPTYYTILLRGDNKEKKNLTMDLLDRATDTLIVNEYPFDDLQDANNRNYIHRNYFVRR